MTQKERLQTLADFCTAQIEAIENEPETDERAAERAEWIEIRDELQRDLRKTED
jgi:hypothetical protein